MCGTACGRRATRQPVSSKGVLGQLPRLNWPAYSNGTRTPSFKCFVDRAEVTYKETRFTRLPKCKAACRSFAL